MTISIHSRKMLWGRAANRCAICHQELVIDSTETDDESIVGDECHIISRSDEGPRGEANWDIEKLDKYENLLLLCKTHHKLIDDQPNTFSVEKLKEIKKNHEEWVKISLEGFDETKQKDDELYASYIETWEKSIDIENWKGWSSFVMGSEHSIDISLDTKLEELRIWLLSRVWPKRYIDLENSFENFRRVLEDFQRVFRKHSIKIGDDVLSTNRFYHIQEWDEKRYNRLLKEYEFHVAIVEDLLLELTRAANKICNVVRKTILPTYRIKEGVILVESGPYGFLEFKIHRVEYRKDNKVAIPYPGLKKFLVARKSRDYHFGEGTSADDSDFAVGEFEFPE